MASGRPGKDEEEKWRPTWLENEIGVGGGVRPPKDKEGGREGGKKSKSRQVDV